MQNVPGGSEIFQIGFRAKKKKRFTQNVFGGLCDASYPYKNLVQKLGQLAFSGRRFKSPF
jgi:hypothetical protein